MCESNLAARAGSLNACLSHQQWERRIVCDVCVLVKGITRSWGGDKVFCFVSAPVLYWGVKPRGFNSFPCNGLGAAMTHCSEPHRADCCVSLPLSGWPIAHFFNTCWTSQACTEIEQAGPPLCCSEQATETYRSCLPLSKRLLCVSVSV